MKQSQGLGSRLFYDHSQALGKITACLFWQLATMLIFPLRIQVLHPMIQTTRYLLLLMLFLAAGLPADELSDQENLMNDLLVVDYWNKRINERLPVTYNHLLQGGYFAMPSARMGAEGEMGFGYSHVPPYRNYNLRCQVLDRLEITGNYRVFSGIDDPVLSQHGYGDFSDKGANFKLSLFSPEDSEYALPGIAIGYEDFIGTRAFHARYIVFTQVFLPYHLEVSLGYGAGRIKGFFGGFNLMPFRKSCWRLLQPLSLTAEYDATPYHSEIFEKHPGGRVKKSPLNFGLKYRAWDYFDFSISYIRGSKLAFSASTFYNLGETKGFLPKIDDALPYQSPVNTEPLGLRRPEEVLAPELLFAFQAQSLTLLDIYLSYNACQEKVMRLNVLNETYRLEREVRDRLNHLLGGLIPADIDEVVVVINSEGFPIQEYHYRMDYVRLFAACQMGPHELNVLTPLTEVTFPAPYSSLHLVARKRNLYNFELMPRMHTLFGSASGKFKYALGLNAAFNGFLWQDIYYSALLGYNFITNLGKQQGYDRLNPSQLIQVRTDVVKYYHQRGFTIDEAFLQKNWNLSHGLYARIAVGYFEEEYGGMATEFLYYPLKGCWAIGLNGAILKKRCYRGLGFTDKIRQLKGFKLTHKRFLGSQYFLNLYYDWKEARLDFKVTAGKFLANDWGVRNEISHYFPSGLRMTVWYTWTSAHDKINGQTYFDKGVAFSLPFDIFYTYSERSRWNYGMSAWLRDVGVQALTGLELYELINEQRQ